MKGSFQTERLDQGYAAGAMDAKIVTEGRTVDGLDYFFTLAFVACVGAWAAVGFSHKPAFEINNGTFVFEEWFLADAQECQDANGLGSSGRRVLDETQCGDVWCIFDQAPYVPIVTILIVPIIAAIWLVAMYKYSATVSWAAVVFNLFIYFFIGLAFLVETNESTLGLLFIGLGVFLSIMTYCYRAKVWMAARHLKTATLAISKNLQLYAATGVLEVLVLLVLAAHWWFLMQAGKVLEIEPTTCFPIIPDSLNKKILFKTFALMWMLAFLNYAKLVTTAMVVGGWFFQQSDRPSAFGALRISMTKSIPALSSGSVIASLVEFLVAYATSNFWWTDPLGCFLKCLFMCFQGCIMALTRFAVISHAFTGVGFFSSSKRAFKVMQKNFAGAYVTSKIGIWIMRTGTSTISLCVGLAAWQWLDTALGATTLQDVTGLFGGMLGTVAFIFLYLWFVRRPLFTLLTMSLVFSYIGDSVQIDREWFFPIAAIFVSCISQIILSFNSDVVLDSLDTIFMSFAVARDNSMGKPMDGPLAQVYVLMESKDVEGVLPTAQLVAA